MGNPEGRVVTSRTRVVGYTLISPGGRSDSAEVEWILRSARAAGVVTEFDTGRGGELWFEGPPGKALREVRRAVLTAVRRYDSQAWYAEESSRGA